MPTMRKKRARRIVEGFGQFLAGKRDAHNLTQEDVARLLGIAAQTMSAYERNDVAFSREQCEKVAAALGDDPAEWLQAAGLAEEPFPQVKDASPAYVPKEDDATLPFAGTLNAASRLHAEEEKGEVFPCLIGHAKEADFVIRVEGMSGYPLILPGDYVAFRKSETASPGDIVVAKVGMSISSRDMLASEGSASGLSQIIPLIPRLRQKTSKYLGWWYGVTTTTISLAAQAQGSRAEVREVGFSSALW